MSSTPRSRKRGGFTLIELVIVMVIIGVLASISVPVYRVYVKKAMASEGRSLCDVIASAEKSYHVENSKYVSVAAGGTGSASIVLDARGNKYFTQWAVAANATTGDGATFTASTSGVGDATGITVTYTGSPTTPAVVTDGL